MWKPEHRIAADRSGLRYPSDLTGAEWALVEPMVPPGKHGGRKRTIDVREILNGIFYVLILALSPTVLDRRILALDIARFLETLMKPSHGLRNALR